MRVAVFGLLAALAVAIPAAAETMYPATEAAQHVGQTVTITGVLANTHVSKGHTLYLDIGGTYPDNPFQGVIFQHGSTALPDFRPIIGKTVAITGEVKMYHGKPQIIVDSSDQIKFAR
jgi:exonuclease VII large subunit